MDIDPQAAAKSPFLIGLLGGIVALRGVPGISWGERVFNATSSCLLAGFLSPAVAEYFGLASVSMQSATAFLVGLFGLNVTATLVEWIRGAKIDDVLPWRKKG